MPIVLLERVPLPRLRTYCIFSFTILSCALYYAHQAATHHHAVSSDHGDEAYVAGGRSAHELSTNNDDATAISLMTLFNVENHTVPSDRLSNINKAFRRNTSRSIKGVLEKDGYFVDVADILLQEIWCIWTLINMAYCCLILTGKLIQKVVFGELRVSEKQHMKDKFWNFVFYKFIFIFGVLNVQNLEDIVLWCAWFSVLGFLHILAQLCKDRFEYLSFSPTTPAWTHAKVLLLLLAIHTTCLILLLLCLLIAFMYSGPNAFAFMAAEVIILIIKTCHVMVRYGIHLWDLNRDGVWENRGLYVYYSELIFELAALSVDFAHHLHMLVWGNIFLSMASLVICMQLRCLFHEFQRRIRKHKNYLRVVSSMQARFPMASKDKLEQNSDDCAICWERMDSARMLPCCHMFHNACLRSWLEQDTSCPTCRMSLSDSDEHQTDQSQPGVVEDAPESPGPTRPVNAQTTNHFFHFDGSRYVSWLPSFSVEVTHTQIVGNSMMQQQVQTSQFDNLARQVQEIFPYMPFSTIVDDLHLSRSIEATIENIMQGRLTAPTMVIPHDPLASPIPHSSSISTTAHITTTYNTAGQDSRTVTDLPLEPVVTDVGVNFIDDESLPSLSSENSSDESQVDATSASGYRFSKSSAERESMFSHRKTVLLEKARRNYHARTAESKEGVGNDDLLRSSQPMQEDLRRRELSYNAS